MWFTSFALLVHYWVEVQTQMHKVANVDTQRCKMLASICTNTALRVGQVFGECFRLDTLVILAKVCGKFV